MLAKHSLKVMQIGSYSLLLDTGRQYGSDVWLLNEPLQIRGSDGQPIVIPVDEQQYYWHPHMYIYPHMYVYVAVAIA